MHDRVKTRRNCHIATSLRAPPAAPRVSCTANRFSSFANFVVKESMSCITHIGPGRGRPQQSDRASVIQSARCGRRIEGWARRGRMRSDAYARARQVPLRRIAPDYSHARRRGWGVPLIDGMGWRMEVQQTSFEVYPWPIKIENIKIQGSAFTICEIPK